MKQNTVVNIAGSVNIMTIFLLILMSLFENIGIELKDTCLMWISILLFATINIIFNSLTENNRYYIFLLSTLNSNLLTLIEIFLQTIGRKGIFAYKE